MSTIQAFFFIGIYFFYFISNNNCRLLTTVQVFDIMFDNSTPPSCQRTKWWTNELRLFLKYFYAGIVQSNLCWKIHNKYVFHVNIHIFVLKYLVQIQIIQNQFKISEGGKWNSHQMLCVYSSRMVKNYRICPIRIEIIHGRHRVVQIYTWAGPLYS
jgi:hypothetical protein